MKRNTLIFLIVSLLITVLIFLTVNREEVKYYLNWTKEQPATASENLTKKIEINKTEIIENQTNLTKENATVSNATVMSQSSSLNITKPLTLKIVDICSGKLEEVYSISEGTTKCLNKESPYQILIEKNSTHLKTSLLDISGFNETFLLNDTVLIYFLFAEDVATISKEIDRIYLEGSDYFYIGNYELQTIWERDNSGNLYISKMIAVLPLYVKKEVPEGSYDLKFYLSVLGKVFYLGEMKTIVLLK
ncbi:MAG: hypothetical protein ACP5JK_01635 [Candidatus Aenigmatarchaeota archaeon]